MARVFKLGGDITNPTLNVREAEMNVADPVASSRLATAQMFAENKAGMTEVATLAAPSAKATFDAGMKV